MLGRFSYRIGIKFKFPGKGERTLWGTVEGTDQLDALENAKWLNPTAVKIWIVESEEDTNTEKLEA